VSRETQALLQPAIAPKQIIMTHASDQEPSSLAALGRRPATIWECALRKPTHVRATCDVLAARLTGCSLEIEIGEKDVAASQESSRVASPVP
jgi:hypothetical protein